MDLFGCFRKNKAEEVPQVEVLQEELKNVTREMKKYKMLAEQKTQERNLSVMRVIELTDILASEQLRQKQELEERVKKLTKLQASLVQEEMQKVEREMEKCKMIENKRKERKDLFEKKFSELEVIFTSERKSQMLGMKERDTTLQENICKLQVSLLEEEMEKVAREMEKYKMMEKRRKGDTGLFVKKFSELEVMLTSERKHQKLDKEKRDTRLQHNNSEFQASLNLSEEQQNSARLDRVQKHAAWLKAKAVEKVLANKDIGKGKLLKLSKHTEHQVSLKLCKECEKHANLDIECLKRDREQLKERVAQLEAILASGQECHEQEKLMLR